MPIWLYSQAKTSEESRYQENTKSRYSPALTLVKRINDQQTLLLPFRNIQTLATDVLVPKAGVFGNEALHEIDTHRILTHFDRHPM